MSIHLKRKKGRVRYTKREIERFSKNKMSIGTEELIKNSHYFPNYVDCAGPAEPGVQVVQLHTHFLAPSCTKHKFCPEKWIYVHIY